MPAEEVTHEGLGLERGERVREPLENDDVHTQLTDGGEPIVQRLDDERCLLGREHRHGMRLEREHHGLPVELAGARHLRAQDRLVAQVDAVEVAERQDHPREIVPLAREVADDAHWRRISYGPGALKKRGPEAGGSAHAPSPLIFQVAAALPGACRLVRGRVVTDQLPEHDARVGELPMAMNRFPCAHSPRRAIPLRVARSALRRT